jgi:CheY-like chemotaxis protein
MPRVLFLEDEIMLVEHLPILLREKGMEVSSTASVHDALDKFANESFDAVLLDIMMPPAEDMNAERLNYGRMTGVEVARRMKDIKPDVPIVVFTVLTNPEVWKELWEAGVARIVNKPSEVDTVADALWQVIRARPRRR